MGRLGEVAAKGGGTGGITPAGMTMASVFVTVDSFTLFTSHPLVTPPGHTSWSHPLVTPPGHTPW